MNIISLAFESNSMIPEKYTCKGENVSPPVEISEPPEDAVSLALIVEDHDAPNGDFVHWIVWNIDPAVKEIPEDTLPISAEEGVNDFDEIGWRGPCPPEDSGQHRYEFRLYALSEKLDLDPETTKEEFREAIKEHVLEESVLVGLFGEENE